MKKVISTIALFVVFNSLVKAQVEQKDSLMVNLNRNYINFSIGPGGIVALFLPAHISYERLFQGKIFGSKNTAIADIGLGGAVYWEGSSMFIINRLGVLTGAGKKHFEAKAGVCYFLDGYTVDLYPSASIGYRKQKPGSHFVFRTGIGFPDAIYTSWGYSF